jgi:hypothetical protein
VGPKMSQFYVIILSNILTERTFYKVINKEYGTAIIILPFSIGFKELMPTTPLAFYPK